MVRKVLNFVIVAGAFLLFLSCSMDAASGTRRSQSSVSDRTNKNDTSAGDPSESKTKNPKQHAQKSCPVERLAAESLGFRSAGSSPWGAALAESEDTEEATDVAQLGGDSSTAESEESCDSANHQEQIGGSSKDSPTGGKVELETFKPYAEPEAKKLCHDRGFPFKREHNEEFGSCYEQASWPAPFACNFEGVLKAFNNHAKLKSTLEELTAQQWYFDDCGVVNGKPIVFLACFQSGGANCVKIEEIRVGDVTILGKTLTL